MSLNPFSYDYKQILIDEIALNGLEGIGIVQLWKFMEKRISSPITEKMKVRFWNYIVHSQSILFYQVPQPLPIVEVVDRFNLVDKDSGNIIDPEYYIDGPYEYCPVENDYGSCTNYKKRALIPHDYIQNVPYQDVIANYGDTLTMVATIEERWQALAPHLPITYLSQLTPLHYGILELIGKGRENGQMTVGTTNLTKIVKDAKFLFYNRKHLQNLDLVRIITVTQVCGGRGIKSLLLRLKRFHQPTILSLPKSGKLYVLTQHLLQKPDYSERTDELIKRGMLTQPMNKRLQKTINVFNFSEKFVKQEHNSKNNKNTKVTVKKRFISLSSKSDESSQSEEENMEEPLKCQYKVGVGLLRQAYERLLEAGRTGLTQIELAHLLDIEFYTSRTICRLFKKRHIVREFLEDKGKQRTARFIPVASTGEIDIKYTAEKNRFLEYMNSSNRADKRENPSTSAQSVSEPEEIPNKRARMEKEKTNDQETEDVENIETAVAEVSVLDGLKQTNCEPLLNSKKNLTLRQLKFANGLLKVTREKLCVSGYQTLSNMVAKEIREPPMDTKALKLFIQKLATEGHIKILKLKWPAMPNKFSILICAPHVKNTDAIIKLKYKEITIRAYSNLKSKTKKKLIGSVTRPLTQFAYPRYMKIQKLHEFLINFVYFKPGKTSGELPEGFASLIWVMPEITVEFAVGNISNVAMSDIADLKISDDVLELKLREAPEDLYRILLQSKSLLNSLKTNLKTLAMLGLIQLVHQHSQNFDCNGGLSNYIFYINRHAKILDTTGRWPRKNVDIAALEKSFYFETFDDVQNYWSFVYDISTNTTVEVNDRNRKNLYPPVRLTSEVKSFDNGDRYGDGSGPCGFDSCFFMDLPRLWRSFYLRVVRSIQPVKKKPQINIPKKTVVKKKKPAKIKKQKILKSKIVSKEKSTRLRRKRCDATIKWTDWDDHILTMCKVAITIMSPVSQPGCLRVRNTVAKDILSIFDPKKTSGACHRRIMCNESNFTLVHKKECMLSELRRRHNLIHKYEGILKKLRLNHATNMSKYINEARIPMMELLWLILEIENSKSFKHKIPCVAMNLQQFKDKFELTVSTANNSYNTYHTPPNSEPVIGTIKEAIIMAVLRCFCNVTTPDMSNKVFHVFNMYPERCLRIAVDDLRKCGAIACKEKTLNGHLDKFRLRDVVHSNYKLSASYERKWISRLNTEFVENVANHLFTKLSSDLKGSPELNCLLCELQTFRVLDMVSVIVPTITGSTDSFIQEEKLTVLDVEMKYKLNSGSVGWKNMNNIETYSEIFQDINIQESFKILTRAFIVNPPLESECYTAEKDIISYLRSIGEVGATYEELHKKCSGDDKNIIETLMELESKNIIKRVGFYENRIVLVEFIEPWCIQNNIIPTPWVTFNTTVRQDILLNWAGVVMNKIFENPGISITKLSKSCMFLTSRAAQDICMFLADCKCIKINVIKIHTPDLFSDDDIVPELTDFNPFESQDNILVFPVSLALTRYAFIRKKLLDEYRNNV